jgi:GNAT superfamily N-acetyltransferase
VVQIVQLDTSKARDARRFVRFVFDLYRDSEYWVPPVYSDALLQLNPKKSPYFEHSEAAFFVAMEGSEVVGRIAALDNHNYRAHHKKQDGFFYLYDSIDDQDVANALYGAAFDWCRAQGLTRIVGPKGFVVFDPYGFLQYGFDKLPAMGITYNYDYYCRLAENAGMEKEIDYNSYYVSIKDFELPERMSLLADKIQERRGIRVRNFKTMAEIREAVPEIVGTYNQTFVENWEFVPITPREAEVVADQMLQITRPDLVKVIVNREDQIVGFLVSFINVGRALQRCRGRLLPFGWFHLLREMKRTEYLDVNGMGILPEYRGLGGNIVMYNELNKSLHSLGEQFAHADMTQMADWVVNMLADANTLGGNRYKVHRVYRKNLV